LHVFDEVAEDIVCLPIFWLISVYLSSSLYLIEFHAAT